MATIAAVASIVNALIAASVWKQIRTPSKTSIGNQVESAHVTAISNNQRLVALTKNLDVPVPPQAERHEAHIHDVLE